MSENILALSSGLGLKRTQLAALVGVRFTPDSRHPSPELPLSLPKQSCRLSILNVR